ncbi:MAG: HAD-IC family P-type ATPase [Gemmataceae bacterium]|nr:HAD-IC family P-type ATPase [Gemmataceae bacterium]
MRGLDRDPQVARGVVERLESHTGVRARANPLTGRVLVDYDEQQIDLAVLVADVAEVELPEPPDVQRPAHPLDPAPWIQSVARTVGAALGLGWIAARRLSGGTGPPPGIQTAATAAAILGLMRSFPSLRNGLRHLLGRDTADVAFSTASIVTLALASNPLGLALLGAEGLILLREVLARRSAWRRYEERLDHAARAEPDAVIRLEPGERTPLLAQILEGTGTALGVDGLPVPLVPGSRVVAGARLAGGPFVLRLQGGKPFVPRPRPAPLAPTLAHRYLQALEPLALGYAALTALRTRSLARTFEALLLVNPRTALIGMEAANIQAAARVLRAGVTVVGTRPRRVIRRPDLLLFDSPRVLTDGVELTRVVPLWENLEVAEVLTLAGGVAAAAGSPWGNVFSRIGNIPATEGSFDGAQARASVDGVRYTLGPAAEPPEIPEADRLRQQGNYVLLLRRQPEERPLGMVVLRPRLGPGVQDLVQACRRHGVRLGLLASGDRAVAEGVASRAGVPLVAARDAVTAIRRRQQEGAFVALVSDSAAAAEAFAACDLAIGLSSGRSSRFPARADVLATDLGAIAAMVETGARRDRVVRDAVALSALANGVGALWGWRGRPGVEHAFLAVYLTAIAALADGVARLSGGQRSRSSLAALVDPRPERWGWRSVERVLRDLNTTEAGLTTVQAAQRHRRTPQAARRHELATAILEQLRYPTTAILAGAGCFSLILGRPFDVAVIASTIAINVAVGAWQERQAGRAAEALQRLGTATARVLRDGNAVTVPAPEVVPGDVLLLAPGDRVAADARVLGAQGLEVDEAALTGESLPVAKQADQGTPETRIVLEGSDVLVGTGRAVIVAVGRHTRLGATAAALAMDEREQSPLGARLSRLLWQSLPLTLAGGGLVMVAGLVRGRPLLGELAVGASIALAAVPEGLPLLAGMGQAGVARRLARRQALVRRLSAVEALGRVDVACTDKTGTLTEGRLALSLVSDSERESTLPGSLDGDLRQVLLTAALASPHPDATDAVAHATDVAVVQGARDADLGDELTRERRVEVPFDPSRSFHAAVVQGRLCVKGAPEALVPRCARIRRRDQEQPLDEGHRQALLAQARGLAERGLRVLMVAEGPAAAAADDPQELVALGFLGISDPLRPTVQAAVRRCREAGVRVLMITGDHPATARAIARAAGLMDHDHDILTGAELAELANGELDQRLEQAMVIARATPLDKLRIIESLRRLGHTVAMTGDGVNDAPALRLADVGVAMGHSGTEVARQAADVVLVDDDFSTLVEALVEGRGFWQNIRRALGLLLGGNLGELGLIAGTSLLGLTSPLNPRQILFVNLITDALPALSVVLQQPGHRNLATLAREGLSALDTSLRTEVLRRGLATAVPSLAAYLLARGFDSLPQASSVAFGSIVTTQLAQTLDVGWTEGRFNRSVLGAVAGSAGLLVSTMTVRPLRDLLGLALPSPAGWTLMGTGALAAVLLGRLSYAGTAVPSVRSSASVPRNRESSPPKLPSMGAPVQARPRLALLKP